MIQKSRKYAKSLEIIRICDKINTQIQNITTIIQEIERKSLKTMQIYTKVTQKHRKLQQISQFTKKQNGKYTKKKRYI